MIEIKAKLMRSGAGIYATGECLECFIAFKNNCSISTDKNSSDTEASKQVENLAWASMQIYCYRKTAQGFLVDSDNAGGKPLDENVGVATGKTSLGTVTSPLGHIIYASKPKILFCDLKLQPDQTKSFICAEILPRTGPPTYRGHDIKYFYRLIISTQRVKSKVQSLVIPIRVLPIPIIARPEELTITEETNDNLAPTNPFLEKRELSELEMSWHHLKNITARRAPKFYRISNKHGCVAHFCLFKPSYKLGEDIVGSLDFSKGNINCIQFLVKLQSVEIRSNKSNNQIASNENSSTPGELSVNNPSLADANSVTSSMAALDISSIKALNSQQPNTTTTTKPIPQNTSSFNHSKESEMDGKVATHVTSHEMCYALLKTEVVLNIPLHLTPTFHNNLIELRYRLHFEFVISKKVEFCAINCPTEKLTTSEGKDDESDEKDFAIELRSPNEVEVETMIWDLPITLYATNPLQIYVPPQQHQLVIK